MTAAGLLALGLGVLLIWTAVTGDDPRDVLAQTFRPGKAKAGAK